MERGEVQEIWTTPLKLKTDVVKRGQNLAINQVTSGFFKGFVLRISAKGVTRF